MGIFNDLIEDLLERNQIEVRNAAISIALKRGSIKIGGQIPLNVVDTQKHKMLASLVVPIDANIEVKDVTFPIPTLQ